MTTTILAITIALASGQTQTIEPGLYVVTASETPIRCGASSKHYPFLMAEDGSTVRVVESRPGWARVAADGPVFADSWAWIRRPANADPILQLGDGRSATTLDTTEVNAVNLNGTTWNDSKGWACTLDPGTTVEVIDTSPVAASITGTNAYVVHRIVMPASATGWIATDVLSPATNADITAFAQGWRDAPTWAITQPTSPLTDWASWSMMRPKWIAAQQQPVEIEVVAEVIEPPVEEVVEVIEVVKAPVYHNKQWDALEQTLATTPLYSLNATQVAHLRAGYVAVIDEEATAHPEFAERATFRLKQLDLAASINSTHKDIVAAQARILRSSADLSAQAKLLDESPEYVIRGTLAVSPMFNGVNRPLYYRLQDPFSGRSLAYISPDSAVDVRGMLGQRVGIVGRMHWNDNWQIQTVTPERVDLVSVTPPQ